MNVDERFIEIFMHVTRTSGLLSTGRIRDSQGVENRNLRPSVPFLYHISLELINGPPFSLMPSQVTDSTF